jgi:hypothetical protein
MWTYRQLCRPGNAQNVNMREINVQVNRQTTTSNNFKQKIAKFANKQKNRYATRTYIYSMSYIWLNMSWRHVQYVAIHDILFWVTEYLIFHQGSCSHNRCGYIQACSYRANTWQVNILNVPGDPKKVLRFDS